MIASRHGADRRLQPRHDLDIERDAGLLPAHRHDPVSDMLPAHSYHVAAGLPGLLLALVGRDLAGQKDLGPERPNLVVDLLYSVTDPRIRYRRWAK